MIRGVVLDLDGTVYLSGHPLPGAVSTIGRLRDAGVAVVFVSNNPTVDASAYARRLTDLGIPTSREDVLTSGGIAVEWLREHHPTARTLLVSEASLRRELEVGGCSVTDDPTVADLVLVSFDRTFDYAKWRAAFDALRLGAGFIATNPDATCPVDGGEVPDCAGIIAALEATTYRRVEMVLGKPSSVAAHAALNRLSRQLGAELAADEVLAVGDRLETDVRLGAAAGFATALVLSGVTRHTDLRRSQLVPDHVLGGIADLPGIVLPANVGTDQERSR